MTATVTKTSRGSVVACAPCGIEEVRALATHAASLADGHNAARHLAEIEGEEGAVVVPLSLPRRFRAWCEEHRDGYQGGKVAAQKWADRHNDEAHA